MLKNDKEFGFCNDPEKALVIQGMHRGSQGTVTGTCRLCDMPLYYSSRGFVECVVCDRGSAPRPKDRA